MGLIAHLLSVGGEKIFGDQIQHDPDCELILSAGMVFDGPRKLIPMQDHQCHWNVSKLYKAAAVDAIVIGYALNSEGYWFQHTWGLSGSFLVETSEINFKDIQVYFGAVLTDPLKFANWCDQNPSGAGRVRRI